jgi:peptidoglycan LD-endopeptidase CwlK
MAADLDQLDPVFKAKMLQVYAACMARGYEFRPNFTGRTPWEQARLWRQGHSFEQVQSEAVRLGSAGARYLADILLAVGPQHGPWATNALPGMSWHNFKPAKACDSFLLIDGKVVWDGGHPGYLALAEGGAAVGLTNMRQIHDYGHLQLEPREVPDIYNLAALSQAMQQMWGLQEIPYSLKEQANAASGS